MKQIREGANDKGLWAMATTNYWYVDHDSKEEKETEKKKHGFSGYENRTSSNSERIIVSLLPEYGTMSQLVLPVNPEGKYSFSGENNLQLRESVHIQPYHEKWYLYSLKPVHFLNESNKYLSYVEMKDQELVLIKNLDEEYRIYVEYVTKQAFVSHNYAFLHKSITIGSSDDCDITYHGKYVSAFHAEMIFDNNQWEIVARGQANSFLVNGKRMKNSKINVGDMIYIMGLKLIMGVNFISINDGNERVKIHGYKLNKIHAASEISFFEDTKSKPVENELFNRLPRRRMPLNKKEIKIEAPPMTLSGEKIPLMLRMGGSMVMGANSVLMGHYAMVLSSVLFPILTSKYTDKQKKEYEKRRVEKYTQYLDDKSREIVTEQKYEQNVLNHNYPELEQVLSYPYDGQRLWERRKTDDDFLNIRLGYGDIPLLAEYKYPEERFELEEDPLESKMYELVNRKVSLNDVPIVESFVKNFVCGILGSKRLTLSFVKRLVMQIAISHSYDEVKMVFLIDEKDLMEMEYFRYIPHVWNDQKTFRFLATNAINAFQISEYLKKEIEEELLESVKLNEILKRRPYYMVFALDKKIFDSMEVLKDIMQLENSCGISVITAFEDLPKECFKIFQLNSNGDNAIIHLKELDQEDTIFRLDRFDEKVASASMNKLANTNLKLVSQAYALPKMITFLEMYSVGRIEHLNLLQRWHDNNPVKSLAAPVGVGTDGTLFELDLHEKYQGPHGLIAGMTGSGKSEFIITYILSMAINYHPDEVAFLLIDYKGGGLARAFEDKERGIHLPHLVGTITNLDGAAIQRSLTSIRSENMRRQRIFNEVKSKTGESSIDIYDYQALYRAGKVEEAMPHLFIIADEFAELKQQEPEFMDKLISTARIGRSLGVHLILATQKPAGVVNEQIRSNTKFRVCLKVQEKSDSMDMLKRPEGAELKETGRFYLQVGYNEYFALGQSAWSGAPYEPQDEVLTKKDDSIQFVDRIGHNILEVRKENPVTSKGKSQLTEIVQYLSDMAKRENIAVKQLWKEPLGELIDISELRTNDLKSDGVSIYTGMIDNPEKQEQFTLKLDFRKISNLMVVGEGKSGKTTFIETMLLSLASQFAPDEIQFYILDYSSRRMKSFQKLPHCGAVLYEEESDSLDFLCSLIEETIQERKELFTKLEADGYDTAIEKQKIPIILMVIDNIVGLNGTKKGEKYYFALQNYMKAGASYGIKYIISCNHLSEINMKIRKEFNICIAFRMKDKYEYTEALGCRCTYVPSEIPGRGLYNYQGTALEMQMAMFYATSESKTRFDLIKEKINHICGMFQNYETAKKLPDFSSDETYETFLQGFATGRIPLGYSLQTRKKVALPFKQFAMLSLYFGNSMGKEPVIHNLMAVAQKENMAVSVVKNSKESMFGESNSIITVYNGNDEGLTILWKKIAGEVGKRKVLRDTYCEQRNLDPQNPDHAGKTYAYMRKQTKAQLIIFESLVDVGGYATDASNAVISKLFEIARYYNTYFVGCFYPTDSIDEMGEKLLKTFNPDELYLYVGGKLDKVPFEYLPKEYADVTKVLPYNQLLMKYREEYYPLYMPCGELIRDMEDADDMSIF